MIWSKVLGWVKAVDGISFAIPQGETLAIVGESGCGKTTTAKLILRLEEPTEGHVFVDGQDVHTLRGAALKEYRTIVQAVFQDPWSSLSPRMRVRDIVAEPLVINGKLSPQEVKARVAETLEHVGLRPQQAALYPHEFSGGQRQRVAIARAILRDAPILILDEATSHLDAVSEQAVRSALELLSRDRTTVVIAHRLSTVRHADQIIVLDDGRIAEIGAHETLLARGGLYAHLVSRQLTAAAPRARSAAPSGDSDRSPGGRLRACV